MLFIIGGLILLYLVYRFGYYVGFHNGWNVGAQDQHDYQVRTGRIDPSIADDWTEQ